MANRSPNSDNGLFASYWIAFAAIWAGLLVSCSTAPDYRPQVEPAQTVKTKETPIALQVTERNKGKRCEAKNYPGPEENRECYDLQKQLIEAALVGEVVKVKDALRYGAHPDGTYYQSLPALQVAAMNAHAETVSLLLDNGADVNLIYPIGNTALKTAVFHGRVNIVKALLVRGADVCDKRQSEVTAQKIAEERGNKEIVELLKSAKCN